MTTETIFFIAGMLYGLLLKQVFKWTSKLTMQILEAHGKRWRDKNDK